MSEQKDGEVRPNEVKTKAASEDNFDIKTLLQVMLGREKRQADKEKDEEDRIRKRAEQREFNAQHHVDNTLKNQANCKHLKGGRRGPKSQQRDFAVYSHTDINAEQVIKCALCKMTWKKNDTREFLIRHGHKKPNHTGIGWREANDMLLQSTNTPSTAEIPLNATPASSVSLVE